MLFYFLLTAAVSAVGVILRCTVKNDKTYRMTFCLLAFIVLGSISAFRFDVGYDYSYIYRPLYEPILQNPFITSSELVHEPGFVLLERLIALASSDYQMLFIVTSYLIVGLFMLYYYLYSPGPAVCVFLFLSLGQFYCSMNFIRQTLAGVICLFALPLLQRRKFWRYCAIVLVASLFHTSALIMLAFYFINLIPVKGNVLLVYVPVAIIFYLSSSGMIELITQYIYGHYDENEPSVALGFPLTALAILVFLFLFLFLNRKTLTKRKEKNYVYINYAFFAMLFMFLGTKHSILNRFALYFELAVPMGLVAVLSERRKELSSMRELLDKIKSNAQGVRRASAMYAACLIAIFGGGTVINYYILDRDSHGVIPYQLIFAQPFYRDSIGLGMDSEPLKEPDDWWETASEAESDNEPVDESAGRREDISWIDLPDEFLEEPAG